MKFCIAAAVVAMAAMLYTCQVRSELYPVILVPGSGGNQLEARLSKDYKASSLLCRVWSPARWFRLWFDPLVLIEPFTKCFAERMMLYYDAEEDDYRNAAGVETRVPHFGSTRALLCLNPLIKHLTAYMSPLVDSLHKLGYSEGQNLYGAPYDFRYGLAPQGHPSLVGTQFLQNLKNLIEQASHSNAGKPVIVLSHSLGGLFVLHLLNRNPQSWCRQFIKHFVALSAPWGGTVQQMLTFASGNSLGVPLVDPLLVRAEQRSSESNLWLLPSPKLFGGEKQLVITRNATYSALDMPRFLKDIGFVQGVYPYESRILPLNEELMAPEVPVTCIVGSGVRTPERFLYGENGFDGGPDEVVYGDGDGTVNMLSLLALESEWAGEANQFLKITKVPNVSHTSILSDDAALEVVMREISDINLSSFSELSCRVLRI